MTLEMYFSLFGGLGLFIFGMNVMSNGLKTVAGDRMKRLLEILTNNKIMAIIVGTIVTMIVQSSSTTTVMVIGFVNAGLMNLFQAAGVILGANIGTTITAQLVAFKVTHYAPIFIGLGTFMTLFCKKKRNRQIGEIILGFGILFLGISIMSATMRPLRESQAFVDLLISFADNPLLGLLAGFGITAIIQSSSASIGLLQAIAFSGAFASINGTGTLSIVIPILLGTNIGTCVTAMLSSIGTNTNAKKAALIHLFVNIFGSVWVLVLLGGIDLLAPPDSNPIYQWIVNVSGMTDEGLPNVARQIANAHTLFNVINMIVLFPFLNAIVTFVNKILPKKESIDDSALLLDERLLENPAVAVGQTIKEVARMGKIANMNLKDSFTAILEKNEKLCETILNREKTINDLERDLTYYLVKLSNSNLSELDHNKVMSLFHNIHDIERIGDHAENLVEFAQLMSDNKINFSESAIEELTKMMDKVVGLSEDVIKCLENEDVSLANKALKIEDEVDEMEKRLRKGHIERLNKGICIPASGVIYLDIITNLERVGDHANNIAQEIIN